MVIILYYILYWTLNKSGTKETDHILYKIEPDYKHIQLPETLNLSSKSWSYSFRAFGIGSQRRSYRQLYHNDERSFFGLSEILNSSVHDLNQLLTYVKSKTFSWDASACVKHILNQLLRDPRCRMGNSVINHYCVKIKSIKYCNYPAL